MGWIFQEVMTLIGPLRLVMEDQRRDYGEVRNVASGFIGTRLHVLVFTKRNEKIRIIGLRKANAKEQRLYAQATGMGHC